MEALQFLLLILVFLVQGKSVKKAYSCSSSVAPQEIDLEEL